MLHLLGTPHYSGRDGEGRLPPSLAMLVAALALNFGNRASRQDLAEFLYEAVADPGNDIRQLLWRARDFERRRGIRLICESETHVWRDEGAVPADIDRLADGPPAHCGPLLASLDPPGSELRQWLQVERARIDNLFAPAAATISARPGTGPDGRGGPDLLQSTGKPRLALLNPTTSLVVQSGELLLASAFVDDINQALYCLREVITVAPFTIRQLQPGQEIDHLVRLGTDYAMTTEVIERNGGRAVSLSVAELSTGTQIWRDHVDLWAGTSETMLAAIISNIAKAISLSISGHELRGSRDVGRTAYRLVALGRQALGRFDLPNIRRAKTLFRRAIDAAPGYPTAHIMLSRAMSLEWVLLGRADRELLDLAAAEAGFGLEIDPYDPAGHRELARVSLFRSSLEESVAHYATAERLAPHHADILADSADTLMHAARLDEAEQRISFAMLLNPLPPDEYRWTDGSIRFFQHDFPGAMAAITAMRNPDPAARLMAAAAAMMDDAQTAARYRRIALDNHPDFTIEGWMQLMPLVGEDGNTLYVHALKKAGFR